jgi:putative ATP-binding cassette transporter
MSAPSNRSGTSAEVRQARLGPQLGLILRALRAARVGRSLLWLAGAIVLVVVATAYGQIRLNAWNKGFFDALARRDWHAFVTQLGVFAVIAGALLVLNVGQRWLVETLKMRLREALVQDLVGHWLRPCRAFWLAHAGNIGVNPDQRMHDDTRMLCEMSADLGVGLLQAAILFVSFAGILWQLSADFSLRIAGVDYPVPGFMLWAAIGYALAGSVASYWVGRSLIERNAERYAREGELRFSLVHINEHLDGISLAGGEPDEQRRVDANLQDVLAATARLIMGNVNLAWVTAGFGWVMVVAPILAAAPLFFAGKISFGGVMMAAAAFTQAQSSLRWFVDNFSALADWRAILLRVAGFRQALAPENGMVFNGPHIEYRAGPPGCLAIEALQVDTPNGRYGLRERKLRVRPGERVLIVGVPGSATTALFRALAGLWPWGSGCITRPQDEAIFYLPRGTPYLPRGSLREVLAYPRPVADFADAAYAHALARLDLKHLVPLLNERRRWERELSLDEQLNLAFARLVLHAPPWVLIDDAFGALADDAFRRVLATFAEELKNSGIVHIGRAVEGRDPMFSRVLHLVKLEAASAGAASAHRPRRDSAPTA